MRYTSSALAVALGLFVSGTGGAAEGLFDHGAWAAVLERFVDSRGLVDYDGLAANRGRLDAYLAEIAEVGPTTSPDRFPTRSDELAYYLNAYNALVFEGVLDRGPERESVWSGGLISGYRFFVKRTIRVDGGETSLKSLEDDVVRARFEDPRIHAALNCASVGCPRLPQVPFTPDELDAQLEGAMRELVAEERNCAVDRAAGVVVLSKIFDWFESDFLAELRRRGVSDPRLIDYVNLYREPEAAIPRSFKVRFATYDKRVNRQPSP